MWKKLIYFLAAVLVGIVVFAIVVQSRGSSDERETAYERLAHVGQKLREAGSAQVNFDAEIKRDSGSPWVRWVGTSLIRFGDTPSWDTTYSRIQLSDGPTVQAHRVHDGTATYVSSPGFVPEDGRAWIRTPYTTMFWPNRLADLSLGITDFTMWQRFLDNVQRDNAAAAVTDELKDVADARHEYRLRCTPGSDAGCPPPWNTILDQYFNRVPDITLSVWIRDDGRLRRLEVANSLWYDISQPGANPGVPHDRAVYEVRAVFDFDKLGTPVTVKAPPADQVTQARAVSLKT